MVCVRRDRRQREEQRGWLDDETHLLVEGMPGLAAIVGGRCRVIVRVRARRLWERLRHRHGRGRRGHGHRGSLEGVPRCGPLCLAFVCSRTTVLVLACCCVCGCLMRWESKLCYLSCVLHLRSLLHPAAAFSPPEAPAWTPRWGRGMVA